MLVACTQGSQDAAPRDPIVQSSPPRPSPSSTWLLRSPVNYGGANLKWPKLRRRTHAPPAYGAVVTVGPTPLTNGHALKGGLTLPIVGGPMANPLVLTPCMTKVRIDANTFTHIPPASASTKVVVIDPGHGGWASPGAVGPDGSTEAVRNLQVANVVRQNLHGAVDRVVMTRTTDRVTLLDFRVALADALRASFAISIHFNSQADGPSNHPGTTTFGSVADPHGRRAAGIIFEAERAYLETLTPILDGKWVAYHGAGAMYRIGDRGDFYRLLRESHVTWVLSEAMFISNAPEAKLLGLPQVREGLGEAIATGVMRYLTSNAKGSGWRPPVLFGGPDAGGELPCSEPYA
jgi:N-acetylmuramoyl-L-alanine amidase